MLSRLDPTRRRLFCCGLTILAATLVFAGAVIAGGNGPSLKAPTFLLIERIPLIQ